MDIKNGIQSGELQQIGHLPAGVSEFELPPGLSLFAGALRARAPLPVLVFKYCCAAGRADCLRHGAERHDEFTQSAAIDVGNILQVEKDFVLPGGNLVSDGLAKSSQGIAGCDPAGKIHYRYTLACSARRQFELHR
jgi:hypothetical protein